jgi:hypothetical protein
VGSVLAPEFFGRDDLLVHSICARLGRAGLRRQRVFRLALGASAAGLCSSCSVLDFIAEVKDIDCVWIIASENRSCP